ncbi:phosphotransferase [Pseudoduganella eburnea]|uniref:Phosphotransferase n=1 Tax=Massilia eburnea TaxID=1776165 RepID=A0A6L6QC45_9BURK|nr:phosphotransferase family protein [Massilia eburnea]MTW10088.1 phosphotransferase [Massilia eburnea]
MTNAIADARAVRDEDRLDTARLDAYLKSAIPGLQGEPALRQFQGGASNLTYLVSYGDRNLVLRRAPAGAAAGAHDMLREAGVMAALKPSFTYVPAILARSDDASIVGAPFFAMECLPGIILRSNLPAGFPLDAAGVRKLCTNVLDRLIELQGIDATQPALAALGKGEGYVERQFGGWTSRWQRAQTEGTDACEDVIAWLAATRPKQDSRLCVIHNDYRFDNVVLDPADPTKVIGVLDWEMATLGDPLMDLGGSLAYWVEAGDEPAFQAVRRQPTHAEGMFTRREVLAYYVDKTGMDTGDFAFYEVFGLFRLMVIAQQIYRRYVLGQTTNEQFASLGVMVGILARRCRETIAAGGSL